MQDHLTITDPAWPDETSYDTLQTESKRFETLVDNKHFKAKINHSLGVSKILFLPLKDGIKFDELYIKYNTYVITTFFFRYHDRGLP